MMERIFNDVNEPFWRSAKKIELGLIDPRQFARFIKERFDSTNRGIDEDVVDGELESALTKVLRSENAHFTRPGRRRPRATVVLQALSEEPAHQR